MQFDLTTAVELTQRLYPDGLEEILFKKSKSWGMITKKYDFTDEGKFLTWKFGTGGGHGSTFSAAQANKGASDYKRPFIERKNEYALASMDGELLDATGKNSKALASVFQQAMDDATYNITRSLAFHGFRDGRGIRGTLAAASSGIGTATITLTSDSSIQGLEKNMWVQLVDPAGSGSVRPGRAQITAVNRAARTVTTNANWNVLITGAADGDYLIRESDWNNVIDGFSTWIPATAPAVGESFKGIDRGVDPDRLAGLRFDGTAYTSLEEVLLDASAEAFDNGAEPDLVFMSPKRYSDFSKELGSKRTIPVNVESAMNPKIGYKGIQVMGAGGDPITVLADSMCQHDTLWLLTQDTWEDWGLGKIPRILERDGNRSLREANADADELRVGARCQRVCTNPGANMRISLSV